MSKAMRRAGFLIALALSLAACTNLKDFQGAWTGSISKDSSVRQGLSENTQMTLNIQYANSRKLEATLSTCTQDPTDGTCTPTDFQDTPLEPLKKVQNDTLNSLTFGGEPYAVYMMTAQPVDPDTARMLVFVSLHGKDRVEIRLLRGQEVYGVFRLTQPNLL